MDPAKCEKFRKKRDALSHVKSLSAPIAHHGVQVPTMQPHRQELVGTKMKQIINAMHLDPKLLPPAESCQCEDLALQMDAWGIAGCESNRKLIVDRLTANAAAINAFGAISAAWNLLKSGRVLNPLAPADSLLSQTIYEVRQDLRQQGITLNFAYAVMTCGSRLKTYLPRTLESLAKAGFESPRVYVDGASGCVDVPHVENATIRTGTPVGPFGAWMATAWELFTRQPDAERFVIFQDDIVASLGLREFLEHSKYPDKGYCNLCTYPVNAERVHFGVGWYEADQKGQGAQGLMFSNEAFTALLHSPHLSMRVSSKNPGDVKRRWKFIDGAVVTAMKGLGYREFVHDPSLVSHIGDVSAKALHNPLDEHCRPQPPTALFRGEDFDLRTLLK